MPVMNPNNSRIPLVGTTRDEDRRIIKFIHAFVGYAMDRPHILALAEDRERLGKIIARFIVHGQMITASQWKWLAAVGGGEFYEANCDDLHQYPENLRSECKQFGATRAKSRMAILREVGERTELADADDKPYMLNADQLLSQPYVTEQLLTSEGKAARPKAVAEPPSKIVALEAKVAAIQIQQQAFMDSMTQMMQAMVAKLDGEGPKPVNGHDVGRSKLI